MVLAGPLLNLGCRALSLARIPRRCEPPSDGGCSGCSSPTTSSSPRGIWSSAGWPGSATGRWRRAARLGSGGRSPSWAAALYYLVLCRPRARGPVARPRLALRPRLRALVLLPYIGAGLVALAGGCSTRSTRSAASCCPPPRPSVPAWGSSGYRIQADLWAEVTPDPQAPSAGDPPRRMARRGGGCHPSVCDADWTRSHHSPVTAREGLSRRDRRFPRDQELALGDVRRIDSVLDRIASFHQLLLDVSALLLSLKMATAYYFLISAASPDSRRERGARPACLAPNQLHLTDVVVEFYDVP